jgi:hypothetical protein
MQRGLSLALFGMLVVAHATPSWAAFERMEDRQEELSQERARNISQADDIAKIREAMQENNILLKGIIIEMRKQTELLDAINAEQKNQSLDLSRQTELLEQSTGAKPAE